MFDSADNGIVRQCDRAIRLYEALASAEDPNSI